MLTDVIAGIFEVILEVKPGLAAIILLVTLFALIGYLIYTFAVQVN